MSRSERFRAFAEGNEGEIPEIDDVWKYLCFLHRRAESFSEDINAEIGEATGKILAGIYFGGYGLLNFPTRPETDGLLVLVNVGLGIWGLAEGAVNVSRAINYFSYSRSL